MPNPGFNDIGELVIADLLGFAAASRPGPRFAPRVGARKECAFTDSLSKDRMARRWGPAMTELEVHVIDEDIIVVLPRASYSVTYYKPLRSPQLLAKNIPDRDDPRAPMGVSEFLAKAWKLANEKARELGWIV